MLPLTESVLPAGYRAGPDRVHLHRGAHQRSSGRHSAVGGRPHALGGPRADLPQGPLASRLHQLTKVSRLCLMW